MVFPLLNDSGDKMVKHIIRELEVNKNVSFEAKALSAKFTTENIATCAFGLEGKCFENPNAEFTVLGREMFKITFLDSIKRLIVLIFPKTAKLLKITYVIF